MPINSFIYPSQVKLLDYEVANSCRFNDDDSAYMDITPGSAGNRKTWTFSAWVKRGNLGLNTAFFESRVSADVMSYIAFATGDAIRFYTNVSGVADYGYLSDALFRDISAWYHIIVVIDTTQGTASNRAKLYVNGVQQSFDQQYGDLPEDHESHINTTDSHRIGYNLNEGFYLDGYLAEVCFIDGQALTPTSFGEFDEDSPTIWKPIDVSGLTFGTNGFYLDFEDSADLGADVSGNSNDFTVNNLAATDQCTDTPTNNFATLNGLHQVDDWSLAQGNLEFTNNSTGHRITNSNIAASQGKWYAEVKVDTLGGNYPAIGVINPDVFLYNTYLGNSGRGYGYLSSGSTQFNDSTTSFDNTYTTGDIIGVAMDLDNHKLYFSKNGTFQDSGDPTSGATGTGSAYNLATSVSYSFAQSSYDGGTDPVYSWNFGNPPFSISSGNADADGHGNFEYAVPSGYYALCTKNLAEYG